MMLRRLMPPRLLRKAELPESDRDSSAGSGPPPNSAVVRAARTSNLQRPLPLKVDVLQLILSDDEFRSSFIAFLRAHHAAEGLEFWESVQKRMVEKSSKKLVALAKTIIETHILEGADREIHLSSALRTSIAKAYGSKSTKDLARADFFTGALNELINDLKQNEHFSEFLNHMLARSS